MAVQFDVGELGFVLRSVRNREIFPAFDFHWQHGCYGWRVGLALPRFASNLAPKIEIKEEEGAVKITDKRKSI